MASSCPACGSSAEYTTETVEVLRGSCAACGGAFSIVKTPASGAVVPIVAPEGAGVGAIVEETEEESSGPALACPACGSSMDVEVASPTVLEATCGSCGEELRFVASTGREEAPERRGPRRGRMEREPAPRDGTMPARPCRNCGGPLSFTTQEDGGVLGECASCGNRFSLPPRRDRDGGRSFGRGGPGGRGPPSRGRFDRRGGPPRGGDRPRGPGGFRRYERRPRSDDDDDDRRDRRRRRSDDR